MIAGIDFPSLFDKDNFSTRRTTGHNLYDPESLLTGYEASQGMDYSNSVRIWRDEAIYRAAVTGNLPTSDIPRIAPRVLKGLRDNLYPIDISDKTYPANGGYRMGESSFNVPVREDEHIIATFTIGHDDWLIINRTFAGIRVKHGPWVEWPIIRPIDGAFVWGVYSFNNESNGPEPIPSIITTTVRELLRDRALSLKAH